MRATPPSPAVCKAIAMPPPERRDYLALWFPWLAVERPGSGVTIDAPFALVERVGNATRLAATGPRAAALGLAPGLMLADARARVPDLAVADHDPGADLRWLDRLAAGCGRYTPAVALDPPGGLVLDITGCTHPFGGAAGLVADVVARLQRGGMTVRAARHATPEGAAALARHRDPAADIRTLPVAALRLSDADTLALRRAGLKTVGDVACRPLAAIAARFGAPAVAAIRRITGEAASPLVFRTERPRIAVERRFAEPVARTEYALTILAELAGEAARALAAHDEGGRRFVATFFRSDGAARALTIETGRPTRDPATVMRVFAERVDTLADPIDPGFGFDLIRLAVPLAEPLAAAQPAFDGAARGETAADGLIDRLSARLGRGRVLRAVPRDTHIPELAQAVVPALDCAAPPAWPAPAPGEPPLRPIRLFDPPQRIAVTAEVPDGPPRRFAWRGRTHRVTLSEGPERIAAEWWRANPGSGLTRDYYRVEDEGGARFWIFRHGLYGGETANPAWYVHGLFA